jgi:hypothetical protein
VYHVFCPLSYQELAVQRNIHLAEDILQGVAVRKE